MPGIHKVFSKAHKVSSICTPTKINKHEVGLSTHVSLSPLFLVVSLIARARAKTVLFLPKNPKNDYYG
jgi:hypothetical protein